MGTIWENCIGDHWEDIYLAIINDFKYGYRGKNYNDCLGLFCFRIAFSHPVTKEKMEFKYIPDWEFWNLLKGVQNEKS